MPQSANVYPGGGGDYTTIQAWEDAVDGTALDEKTARIDNSGDADILNANGWTNAPDASNQAFIVRDTADDLHDGTLTGAQSSARGVQSSSNYTWLIQIPYLTIDGIFLHKDNTNSAYPALEIRSAADNLTVKNCYLYHNQAVNRGTVEVDAGVTSFVMENTIIDLDNGTTVFTGATVHNATGGTYTNCTHHYHGSASTARCYTGTGSATAYSTWTGGGFTDNWRSSITWSGDYNMQDDADSDMPGANSTDNATIPTAFASNDYNLVSGDDLIDAGDASNSTSTDYAGTSRSTPDVGVHEFVAAGGASAFPFQRYYGQGVSI